jgi:hypothetical protein
LSNLLQFLFLSLFMILLSKSLSFKNRYLLLKNLFQFKSQLKNLLYQLRKYMKSQNPFRFQNSRLYF